MTAPRRLPHGSWPSPITASSLVAGSVRVGEIRVDGGEVWWSEQRPREGGRTQLVRRTPDGRRHDLFVPPVPEGTTPSARSMAGEYGGGAWTVRDGLVAYVEASDQRLRVAEVGGEGPARAITAEPTVPRGRRYRDPELWGSDGRWLVCERETHEPDVVAAHGEARTDLVAVATDGVAEAVVVAEGADFCSSPAVDPTDDGRLAWITWDHPRMPWDGTELHVATWARASDGRPLEQRSHAVVAGGPDESVVQPGFLADGTLVWCSDRTGWWNPWCLRPGADEPEPMIAGGAAVEIGGPLWVGGLRWWTELSPGRLLVAARSEGRDRLAVVEPDRTLRVLDTPFTEISQVVALGDGRSAAIVAGTPSVEPLAIRIELRDDGSVAREVLSPTGDALDPAWISEPEPITFASGEEREGGEAHGLFYPPVNPEVGAPPGERPPLVVMIHGGPTSHARRVLSLAKQFWTSRGFAVVDVDHGGSTGYGRPFRRLLDGRWGVLDVADAAAAARHLAAEGRVDPERLLIRGGSAGGFTTLAALCFGDTFAAGASHYGIADLSALAADTHKFESRYLRGLVGPWPEARATYEARSPIHHVEGFEQPLIVLQGSDDEVVPPAQAEMIVAALAAKGVPHAYLRFDGEGHGFRRGETIVRALEAELWFYGRVLGFEPADEIEPPAGAPVGLG